MQEHRGKRPPRACGCTACAAWCGLASVRPPAPADVRLAPLGATSHRFGRPRLRRCGLSGVALLHQLAALLAGQVLDGQLHHAQRRHFLVHLGLRFLRRAGAVFFGQHGDEAAHLGGVCHDAYPPERDNAAVVGGVPRGNDRVLVDNAEGRLVTGLYGVEFVAAFGAVEQYFSVGVGVAERHGVGITVVARKRQHARGAALQNVEGLVFGELLLPAAHGTEHIAAS